MVVKSALPFGFRFEPSDEILIHNYLHARVEGRPFPYVGLGLGLIIERNLYGPQAEISDIFEEESRRSRYYDNDEDLLYFFTPLNKKFETGTRICRIAGSGTWTGQDAGKEIKDSKGKIIGWKKQFTLTTTNAKKRKASPSNCSWIMHEYSLPLHRESNQLEYVLCRIRRKVKCSKRWVNEVVVHTAAAMSTNAPPPPPPPPPSSWTFLAAPSMIYSPSLIQSVMPVVNQQYMPAMRTSIDAPPPSATTLAAPILESTNNNQTTPMLDDDDLNKYAASLDFLMEEDEEMNNYSSQDELDNMINNMIRSFARSTPPPSTISLTDIEEHLLKDD